MITLLFLSAPLRLQGVRTSGRQEGSARGLGSRLLIGGAICAAAGVAGFWTSRALSPIEESLAALPPTENRRFTENRIPRRTVATARTVEAISSASNIGLSGTSASAVRIRAPHAGELLQRLMEEPAAEPTKENAQ